MATFLVEILIGVAVFAGVMLLRTLNGGRRRGRRLRWLRWGETVVCTNAECQHHNEPQARYCARCGGKLSREE